MGVVRFRSAVSEDAERILAVKRAAIGNIETDAYTDEQLAAWQPDDDALPAFRQAVESDRFDVLVAEIDGTVAAYGGLSGQTNRIDALFVHPEYMGEGLGSSLVGQFETRTEMRGFSALVIVSSLNAREFYEALGYHEDDSKLRTIDGVDIEFAVMRKSFE